MPTTRAGCESCSFSQPIPNASARAGGALWTTTSAVAMSLASAARPAEDFRSTIDRFPQFERHEETTDRRCYGHDPAVRVAIRRLDLDHLGAELGEE